MDMRTCPACQRRTPAALGCCAACGMALGAGDTAPAAFDPRPQVHADAVAAGAARPFPPVDGPVEWRLEQPFERLFEAPFEWPSFAAPATDRSAADPPDVDLPLDDDRPASTITPAAATPWPPATRAATRAALAAAAPERALAHPERRDKAAHRAAVRRARTRAQRGVESSEILVHDPDPDSRAELCRLLIGFGFGLVLAESLEEALAIAGRQPLAAAFIDVALDTEVEGDGVALCRAVKAARRGPGGMPAALMLLTARDSPLARVRAQLAGCDAVIAKPPSRGDVARALEHCDVPMPADARRH